ncbi:MAG: IMP dehydrogenase [Bacilli bacterium]|nr:IMP dehydrogenase [Bacilli bacterium]
MGKIRGEGFTFDDLLLVPHYSEVTPREVSLESRLTKKIVLKAPLISAAMDTVTEEEMAIALALEGGIGIIHKNLTIEEQARMIKAVKEAPIDEKEYPNASKDEKGRLLVGASLGITADLSMRAEAALKAGADVFSLDSAHGDSKNVVNALRYLKENYPLEVIAGNVATYEGAKRLMENGADAVKVGMGPGSICTTRLVSGCGVPQVTAILEAVRAKEEFQCPIIADGGIVRSGDLTKAIAAGADTIMIGSLFAGCSEAPGPVFEFGGKLYKDYRGMGSLSAMQAAHGSADRYFQCGQSKLVAEGVESLVPYIGSVHEKIFQLLGGLRSGMGYCGTPTIQALQESGEFVKITPASLKESAPHDVLEQKGTFKVHGNQKK